MIANTALTIRRGTSTDSFGYTVDSPAVVATGVPAHLVTRRRTIFGQSARQDRVVSTHKATVSVGADVRRNDRVTDHLGENYTIEDAYITTEGGVAERRLELLRTD